MRKSVLRAATALAPIVAACFAAPAMAQSADATNEEATEDGGFGDIIVTAQGRDQLLQEVPVAITVVDSELIENSGVTDVRGLRQLTPSLQSTTGQSSATGVVLSIRGIGTAGDNPGFEPAVGVFVDGVFRARAGLALSDMPELERVEVLRGPQGTLFGRNTSAGALSIVTAGPKFELGGYVEASYGNYNETNLKGGITGPISDQLAVRVDGGWHKRDGYITEVNTGTKINNTDRYFVRGQLLFDNGSNVQLRMIADYAETDELCCGAVHTSIGTAGPVIIGLTSLLSGGANTGLISPNDPSDRRVAFTPGRDLTEKVKEWGVSGQLDIDFGGVNLTSITAYRDWQAQRSMDIDFSGLDRAYRDNYRTGMKDFTQEVRIQGEAMDGKLDWMLGGFYLNEDNTLTDTIRFGSQFMPYTDTLIFASSGRQVFGTRGAAPFLFGVAVPAVTNGQGQQADNWKVKTKGIGLFTHNIVEFNDQLSLTFGVRWNHETKKITADLNSNAASCGFFNSAQVSATLIGQQTALANGAANHPDPATRAALAAQLAGLQGAILLSCNPTVNTEFNGDYSGKRSEDQITGTARLAYKISDSNMVFASYSKGYKSGGFNLDRGSFDSRWLLGPSGTFGNGPQISDLEFGKETVNSYEIGLKSNPTPFMQFNITGFYQDFDGYQNLRFEGTRFVVRQYDKVISKGVEVELGVRPADNTNLSFGYTYLSAKVDDSVNAADDHNMQLTNQPQNVFTGAFTWTPPINDNVGALLHIDWRAMSEANTLNEANGVAFTRNGPYSVWNARVGLNFNDGKLGVELYGQNLFNRYFNITSFPVPEQPGAYAVYPGQPRFYGVKVKAKF